MKTLDKNAKGKEAAILPVWIKVALVVTLILLMIVGVWFYNIQKMTVRHRIENQLTAIAKLKVDQLVVWRNERENDAKILIGTPLIRQKINQFLADPKDQSIGSEIKTIFEVFAANGPYKDILLMDPMGRTCLSLSGNMEPPKNYMSALAAAFSEHKAVFSEMNIEGHVPVPQISIVAPIFGSEETATPLGAVILINDANQFLYPMIQSWPIPNKTAETLLVCREGDNVLFLNNLKYSPNAALNLRIPMSQTDVPAVMAVLGKKGILEGKDYRGVDVLSVILPVPDSQWFMIAKEDEAEIFAQWHSRATLILIVFIAFIGVLVSIGLVLWHRYQKAYYRKLYQTEAKLRASVERHSITLKAVGDGVIATDIQGNVQMLNPVAENLTGWSQTDAIGRPIGEVFRIINEKTRKAAENPVTKVLHEGIILGLANHTLLISRTGIEMPIADSAAPIRDDQGTLIGVVMVFRDQTDERQIQRLTQIRLNLMDFAMHSSLEELLKRALDETCAFVYSPIGFYHFVETDQKTLSLQQWSTKTSEEFCRAEGKGRHYGIDQAGVWVDCIYRKGPVIHNDYESLPNKKGLPNGHAEIVRELVVPVIRDEKVVAILGVGNKTSDYTEKDAEVVSYIADVTWQIIERKRILERLAESEVMLRKAQEISHIGHFKYNPVTDIIEGSDELFRIFDLDRSRSGLQNFVNVVPHEQREFVVSTIQKTLAEKSGYSIEHSLQMKDGRLRYVNAIGTFTTLSSTDHPVMVGTIQDITERKQAEESLRESEERFKAIVSSTDDAIISKKLDGTILSWNNAAERIFGYTTEEVIGKRLRILIPDDRKSEEEDILSRISRGERVNHFETVRQCKDGRFINISATISPVYDAQGMVVGASKIARDITERKLLEEEKERIQTQLIQAQKMEAIGTLAGGIAHDFNNLLGAIIGYAEMAEEDSPAGSMVQKDVEQVLKASLRAKDLVKQILAFSRHSEIERIPVQPAFLIKEAIKMLRSSLPTTIDIQQDIDPDSGQVLADPTQIHQILVNLGTNAFHAMEETGGNLTISLKKKSVLPLDLPNGQQIESGDFVQLSVRDTGAGIAPDIKEKIFDPYFTTKEVGKGTGMGLSIIHGIVKSYGGFVTFDSQPGEGTVFHVFLPVITQEVLPETKTSDLVPFGNEHILFVDDEEILAEMGKHLLERLGYRVTVRNSSVEALTTFQNAPNQFDLVVTDQTMPNMTGFDIARRMLQIRPGMPIILCTGYSSQISEEKTMSYGIRGFALKPLVKKDIAVLIRKLLDEEKVKIHNR